MEPFPDIPAPDPAIASEFSSESTSHFEPRGVPEEDAAWRNELSARLNRYRARRKAPPPRYPSLKLPFEAMEGPARSLVPESSNVSPVESGSGHAMAPDSSPSANMATAARPQQLEAVIEKPHELRPAAARSSAKIIEFPGFNWGPPPPPPDQLAEPVVDRPRILEVPEVTPTPPALGGITIEPAHQESPERRPGIDIPLQSAGLGRRLAAAFLDGVIVALASALFGFIFFKIAAVRPPQMQLLALAAGIPCLFWAAYQYLMIVYSATTPGLRLVGLGLSRFDGTPANRSVRRWRVLVAWLSAASLGMGYAWAFLDEDVLCWHDRITQTHLSTLKKAKK